MRKSRLGELQSRAGRRFSRAMDEQPLLVGAALAAIGALAALLVMSDEPRPRKVVYYGEEDVPSID